MIRNYSKIALRNLLRHKGYSAINVAGLAVGMACCLVMGLYVRAELGYDRFHVHADRIYRVTKTATTQTTETHSASVQLPIGTMIGEAFPEVERVVRLWRDFSPLTKGELPTVRVGDRQFREERFYYADASFFDVFSFRLVRGDPDALSRPFEVYLTETTARKYFGRVDPVGKTITITDSGRDLRVAGILADAPATSHLKFDFVASFATLEQVWTETTGQPTIANALWTWDNTWVYVLLAHGADARQVNAGMEAFVQRRLPEAMRDTQAYALQPLTDIHLGPQLDASFEPGGSWTNVVVFSTIASFILLIACINFMNLSTARSLQRAREVGVRKAVGAHRRQLVAQFIGEALLMSLLAFLLAAGTAWLILPAFNTVTGKALSLASLATPGTVAVLVGVVAATGILAGIYPALVLSRFRPARVLKGRPASGAAGSALLRKGLVVVQFVISIALFIAAAVVYSQVDFLLNKDLGFDAARVLMVNTQALGIGPRYETFVEEVKRDPYVTGATTAESVIGRFVYDYYLRPEDMPAGEVTSIPYFWTDYHFFDVFDVTFLKGEDAVGKASGTSYVLNEAAAKKLGWRDPIGKRIYREQNGIIAWQGEVVGVVKDFHFRPLRSPIEPLIIALRPRLHMNVGGTRQAFDLNMGYAVFRVRPGNLSQTVDHVRDTWEQVAPGSLFESFFLDDNLRQLYRPEEDLRRLVTYFAALAIFIAALGLLGLASFVTAHRTKEVGVRKVLGASTGSILMLLSRDFVRLVALALVLASPLAYLAMHRWLQGFAFQVSISAWIFPVAGLAALIVALVTISYQSMRVARRNPAEALRYE